MLGAFSESLPWDSAFFEWSERVQRYETSNWNFQDQLLQFEQSGMTDDSYMVLVEYCHEVVMKLVAHSMVKLDCSTRGEHTFT